jgi:hypothetical protein
MTFDRPHPESARAARIDRCVYSIMETRCPRCPVQSVRWSMGPMEHGNAGAAYRPFPLTISPVATRGLVIDAKTHFRKTRIENQLDIFSLAPFSIPAISQE